MQWLTKMVKEQVHSDRVILILDVCHSGAAGQGSKSLTRAAALDPRQMNIGSGQMIICSSLADQVSWESAKYENRLSPLSQSFFYQINSIRCIKPED
jgi:translation elongation factor EF-1alpha